MKRHKMSPSSSKKSFSRHADLTHRKNVPQSLGARCAMRGGIRL